MSGTIAWIALWIVFSARWTDCGDSLPSGRIARARIDRLDPGETIEVVLEPVDDQREKLITEEELDTLDALSGAASPAPWEAGDVWNRHPASADEEICSRCAGGRPVLTTPSEYFTSLNERPYVEHVMRVKDDDPDLAASIAGGVISAANGQLVTVANDVYERFEDDTGCIATPEDAAFILAARVAVPRLVAEVRRLRDEMIGRTSWLTRSATTRGAPVDDDELTIVPSSYDSTADTLAHTTRVAELLTQAIAQLVERSATHDRSKLEPPEKPVFDRVTPQLATLTYNGDEYKASLAEMGPALDHHYAHNRHHPEHHRHGVLGMTLVDLLEMLADWKAAGERHVDGSMSRSLRLNTVRFDIPDGLVRVLWETARSLGWLDRSECGMPFTAPDGTRMFCNVPVDTDGHHDGPHSDGNFDGGQLWWDDSGELTGGWTVASE